MFTSKQGRIPRRILQYLDTHPITLITMQYVQQSRYMKSEESIRQIRESKNQIKSVTMKIKKKRKTSQAPTITNNSNKS